MIEEKEINLWELSDLCTPWCLHVVATLHIAERIEAGAQGIDRLARDAGCDVYALHCVLGHLVKQGIFTESSPGRFALNPPARQLLDPMLQLGLDLEGIGGRLAHTWGTLLDYVRTGEPGYSRVFGLPFWEDLAAHPRIAESFDAMIGPQGHGAPNPHFDLVGGWADVRSVVDVGGGTGAMLSGVLNAHPHLTGMLVDQPKTAARARTALKKAGLAERSKVVGQSFFDPLPPGADLYYLRSIINDWPDRETEQILQRCAEAAHPGGRVVVLSGVGPDDAPKDLSIENILLGGKHRALSEFRILAGRAGLEINSAGPQPSGYFVVECRPA